MKRCSDCGLTKPLTDFIVSRRRSDGHGIYCRQCFAIRDRKSRERRAAKEGRVVRDRVQAPDGFKYCPDCQNVKPLTDFPRNKSSRSGYGGYCKPCHNAKGKATYTRLYGSTREYHLRRRYGIGVADVEAMIVAQGGTCAVCPASPEHVDHDHETGKVRGILCFNCNQALGNVRDDPAILRKLARYLDKHRQDPQLLVIDTFGQGESTLEVAFRAHLAS